MTQTHYMCDTDPKLNLLKLLRKKSISFGQFILSSGKESKYYIDAKLSTLDPQGAYLVGKVFFEKIKAFKEKHKIDIHSVGGLTMGADPIALSIGINSYLENKDSYLRVFSVRKTPKLHGRRKLIEGQFNNGDNVVIIDDVITEGNSTLTAIDAVEAEGGKVVLIIVLVDRQEGGREKIENKGYMIQSVYTKKELLENYVPQSIPTNRTVEFTS